VALTTHPHLELRIKKEQSYTSLPFCAFIARSRENLCLSPSVSESTLTLTAVNKGETLLFPVLCASRRESEGLLAAGGLRVLGRYKRHRLLALYRKRSCWKPPLVASTTARMSVNCRCLAEFVALRLRCGHTETASMETSGGISRAGGGGAVRVIILNVCSATNNCRLTKTDVTLASASHPLVVMTNSRCKVGRSATVCCHCAFVLLSLVHCLLAAVHTCNCSKPLTRRSPNKRQPMKVTRDVCV